MSWRTLVITRRCKLDLNLNYLEIRAEEVKKVHLICLFLQFIIILLTLEAY